MSTVATAARLAARSKVASQSSRALGQLDQVTERSRGVLSKLRYSTPAEAEKSLQRGKQALQQLAETTRATGFAAGRSLVGDAVNKHILGFQQRLRTADAPVARDWLQTEVLKYLATPRGQRTRADDLRKLADDFVRSNDLRPSQGWIKTEPPKLSLAPGEYLDADGYIVTPGPRLQTRWGTEIPRRNPTPQEQSILNQQFLAEQEYQRRLDAGLVSYQEKMMHDYGSVI